MFFGSDKMVPRNQRQDVVVGQKFKEESVLWVPVDPAGVLPVTIEVQAVGAVANGVDGGTVTYKLYQGGHVEMVVSEVVSFSGVASDIIRKF